MIDIDEEDEDYGIAEQLESHFTKILESNVGDVVFYDFDMLKVQYFQDIIFDALHHQLDIVQYNKYIVRKIIKSVKIN